MPLNAQGGATPGCPCDTCERLRAVRRRNNRLLKMGTPKRITKHESQLAVNHVRELFAAGMTAKDIVSAGGGSQAQVNRLRRGALAGVYRYTYENIMAVRPVRIDYTTGQNRGPRTDPTGTRRRAQALCRAGYTAKWLAEQMDSTAVTRLVLSLLKEQGRSYVSRQTAEKMREVYERYAFIPPEGIPGWVVARQVRRSAELGYVPAGAWDDDTMDDPATVPEWTGRCGTELGYRDHVRMDIPPCEQCRVAHNANNREQENRDSKEAQLIQ